MTFYESGPLNVGGKWEQFSDGEGGAIRLEWRIDLEAPALEVWGGRPDDTAERNAEHSTLMQLASLTP